MNGSAVLPMAVAAELMAQAAVSANPGMKFIGYDDMRIQKGVVMSSESIKLTLTAAEPESRDDGTISVQCEICSDGPKFKLTNAKAQIILADNAYKTKSPEAESIDVAKKYPFTMKEVYDKCLFHGEFLQAIKSVEGWSETGIKALSKTSKPVEDWSTRPSFTSWQSDPLMIDAAYQLMILWTEEACGAPSLPSYAKSYRQYIKSFESQDVTISAKAAKKGSSMATAEIDFITSDGKVAARLEGYECTINEALHKAFAERNLGV